MIGDARAVVGQRETPRNPAGRWNAWAAGGVAVLLSVLLVTWALRLWEADLFVPFGDIIDHLFTHLWIKSLIDHGWYLHNNSVGAPGGLDMHDFPLFDSLFFAILKLISLVARDFALTINLYFLLTFPLTALTALLALRRLGVSDGPALVAALLFAFQPYHFLRQEHHLFLASYFLIPPMIVVLLRVYLDGTGPRRPDEGREPGRGDLLGRAGLGSVVVCLLMSCGGIYYAFFSCYLLLVAGLGASLRRRRVGPLATAGLLIGVITLGVLANAAPKLVYDRQHGPNLAAVQRHVWHSDSWGLRLVTMLMPVRGHRLGVLADMATSLAKTFPGFWDEHYATVLGTTGSLGFLLLLGRQLLLRAPRRPGLLDGLALMNAAAVLLAVAGGFGTVFSFLVDPTIRGYNRISIFIAGFALFALALLADKLRARLTRPRQALAYHAALGLVLVGGILDQVSPAFVPPYDHLKRSFAADAEFFGRIEAALPPGALVFQLPSIAFPEAPGSAGMTCYDQLRGYLHSRRLRWSHGTMKGRRGDCWRAWVGGQPPEEMLATLAFAGFDGVHVDRNGCMDRAVALESELARVLGAGPTVVSRDGGQSFFPLAAYAARLRGRSPAAEWAKRREEALHPVTVAWGRGFHQEEQMPGLSFHWSEGVSQLFLENPYARPIRVAVAMRCIAGAPGPATLWVYCPQWRAKTMIAGRGQEFTPELVLPPGRTRVAFTCNARPVDAPFDPRKLIFRVENLSVRRLEARPSPTATAVARRDAGDAGERRE
jgi:hypothetical protein